MPINILSLPENDDDPSTEERKQLLTTELLLFQEFMIDYEKNFPFKFAKIEDRTYPARTFWKIEGNKWPNLQSIGLRVFSLVASTGASERNFSTLGFIHNDLRNKLTDEKVKKMTFIKQNKKYAHIEEEVDDNTES